jgi:hypothetical protein
VRQGWSRYAGSSWLYRLWRTSTRYSTDGGGWLVSIRWKLVALWAVAHLNLLLDRRWRVAGLDTLKLVALWAVAHLNPLLDRRWRVAGLDTLELMSKVSDG